MTNWNKLGIVAVALGAAWLLSGRPSAGQPAARDDLAALRASEASLSRLIERCEKSVVAITRRAVSPAEEQPGSFRQSDDGFVRDLKSVVEADRSAPPSGAGVVIDPAGLVLTQFLVVKPGDQHTVTTVDGQQLQAEIRAADPRSGLAVLAIANNSKPPLQALPIGRAEDLRKGSTAITIGNPFAIVTDGQPTASRGAVTNLAGKANDQANLNNAPDERQGNFRTTLHHFGSLIQTDALLGWSANGGAVINLAGELVGLTTTVSVIPGHEQPAGYAIPLNATFRRVVRTLSEGKEVEYGLLGISFSASSRPQNTPGRPGISVQAAYAGGPAGRAGIRPLDIITDIDGSPTSDADQLQLLVGRHPPSARVEVGFLRNGVRRETTVELSKYYTKGQKIITTPAPRWRGILVDYATALSQPLLEQASREQLIDPAGCVVVADVTPGSVSARQGVKPGMFISHVGGARVDTPRAFWQAVESADSSVSLRFTSGSPEPRDAPQRR